MSTEPDLVPVAIFCYRRPGHLERLLASYEACEERARTRPFLFCDGPRDAADAAAASEVQALAARWAARWGGEVEVSPVNRGLSAAILHGVGKVLARHDRVIVLEDDLVLDPAFLRFHLAGLQRYAEDPRVYQISGHQWFDLPGFAPAFFAAFTTTWGWSTWRRAWNQFDPRAAGSEELERNPALRRRFDLGSTYPYAEMLRHALAGTVQSWGILWYWTVFARRGLVLYPPGPLLRNAGYGEGATNCRTAMETPATVPSFRPRPAFVFPRRTKCSRLRQALMIRAIGRLAKG